MGSNSDADRAAAHIRQVGEDLGRLVRTARDTDVATLLDELESLGDGRRTVLLAAAVQMLATPDNIEQRIEPVTFDLQDEQSGAFAFTNGTVTIGVHDMPQLP